MCERSPCLAWLVFPRRNLRNVLPTKAFSTVILPLLAIPSLAEKQPVPVSLSSSGLFTVRTSIPTTPRTRSKSWSMPCRRLRLACYASSENPIRVIGRLLPARYQKISASISLTYLLTILTAMSATLQSCRVSILVKALPQRSASHGETVCCAGVTPYGEFKRLFPVRFRHLAEGAAFKRWDLVDFKYRPPTSDRRVESCHVMEDTIQVAGRMPSKDRALVLNPLVSKSVAEAAAAGKSLALIRPKNAQFYYKTKGADEIAAERKTYELAASQGSFFDKQLAALEPSPYEFRFKFEDGAGRHDYANGDWEAHAMFFNGRRREGNDQAALDWMTCTFNEQYARKGMLFSVGNMAKRPQTWQLLGVLRVDETCQQSFF